MNIELNKICANNAELRIDIKHMLDKRRKMIEEYNRLNISMQNATDESRRLTSECSESFANRYESRGKSEPRDPRIPQGGKSRSR
jgi:hypothetical protein